MQPAAAGRPGEREGTVKKQQTRQLALKADRIRELGAEDLPAVVGGVLNGGAGGGGPTRLNSPGGG